jgi:hypothetical protein
MRLTGPQVKLLRDAILSGFKLSELKQLVLFDLSKDLDEITTDTDKSTVVFELIEWAGRDGRTAELIRAVLVCSPKTGPPEMGVPR